MEEENISKPSALIAKLTSEKKVAYEFQERKHDHWRQTYELYRDYVATNRLTQRQAVNFPLLKETIKTTLAKIDDPPKVVFKCLEKGDKGREKEFILKELWDYYTNKLNLEGQDLLDKKNVLMTGRSHIKLNFLEKKFKCEVLENWDCLIDPKVSALDIESAKWFIHQNIFRSLREILANKKYEEKGKQELKQFLNSKEGMILSGDTKLALDDKNERLRNLGVDNFDDFGARDVIIELKEHYTNIWNTQTKKFERWVIIYALDNIILFQKKLKDVLGVDFLPFVTWADDIEVNDYWSDGQADVVRVPNKILNIWLSQMLENRTLINYGMSWFDATNPAFRPQSFTPKPFGMYPSPGDPNTVIKQVDIPNLAGSIQEMEFIKALVERVTATTAIEKGTSEKKQITLGETQILAGRSQERFINIAKHYRKRTEQLAEKWYEIMDAGTSIADSVKLYKESFKGNMFEKEIKSSDWKSKAGYKIKVLSSSEQEMEKSEELQKWSALKQMFVNNPALQKIADRRILEAMNLTPEEMKEVESAPAAMPQQPQPMSTQRPVQLPTMPQLTR